MSIYLRFCFVSCIPKLCWQLQYDSDEAHTRKLGEKHRLQRNRFAYHIIPYICNYRTGIPVYIGLSSSCIDSPGVLEYRIGIPSGHYSTVRMSKKKRRRKFIQTNKGRMLVTVISLMIVTVFVLSLIPFAGDDNEVADAQEEGQAVQDSLILMMESANPPLENLGTDERVAGFTGIQSNATDNMRDGGLIDITDDYLANGSIVSLNQLLGSDETEYRYWVEADGRLHQEAP